MNVFWLLDFQNQFLWYGSARSSFVDLYIQQNAVYSGKQTRIDGNKMFHYWRTQPMTRNHYRKTFVGI